METGICNTATFILLIISEVRHKNIYFEQTIGLHNVITYTRVELLKKSLADLITMSANSKIRYYIEQ